LVLFLFLSFSVTSFLLTCAPLFLSCVCMYVFSNNYHFFSSLLSPSLLWQKSLEQVCQFMVNNLSPRLTLPECHSNQVLNCASQRFIFLFSFYFLYFCLFLVSNFWPLLKIFIILFSSSVTLL
jgi:hypothetical protein